MTLSQFRRPGRWPGVMIFAILRVPRKALICEVATQQRSECLLVKREAARLVAFLANECPAI